MGARRGLFDPPTKADRLRDITGWKTYELRRRADLDAARESLRVAVQTASGDGCTIDEIRAAMFDALEDFDLAEARDSLDQVDE